MCVPALSTGTSAAHSGAAGEAGAVGDATGDVTTEQGAYGAPQASMVSAIWASTRARQTERGAPKENGSVTRET